MENVKTLITEIKENLSQVNSSQKDEVRIMKAMINDPEYKVGIYGKNGQEGTYCPREDAVGIVSSILHNAASMPTAEADVVAEKYEFSRNEATAMIGISKEFINTYIQTRRKLPLGGRENFDISISGKEVKASTKTYPEKKGFDENGNPIWGKGEKKIKAHMSAKIHASCPPWVK